VVTIKRGFQPYARNASQAMQGFTQGTQRVQELANDDDDDDDDDDMAGICHVIWLASY